MRVFLQVGAQVWGIDFVFRKEFYDRMNDDLFGRSVLRTEQSEAAKHVADEKAPIVVAKL